MPYSPNIPIINDFIFNNSNIFFLFVKNDIFIYKFYVSKLNLPMIYGVYIMIYMQHVRNHSLGHADIFICLKVFVSVPKQYLIATKFQLIL